MGRGAENAVVRQDGAGGADEVLEVCDPQGRPALHHLLRDIGAVAVRPGPAGAHDGHHVAGLEADVGHQPVEQGLAGDYAPSPR